MQVGGPRLRRSGRQPLAGPGRRLRAAPGRQRLLCRPGIALPAPDASRHPLAHLPAPPLPMPPRRRLLALRMRAFAGDLWPDLLPCSAHPSCRCPRASRMPRACRLSTWTRCSAWRSAAASGRTPPPSPTPPSSSCRRAGRGLAAAALRERLGRRRRQRAAGASGLGLAWPGLGSRRLPWRLLASPPHLPAPAPAPAPPHARPCRWTPTCSGCWPASRPLPA